MKIAHVVPSLEDRHGGPSKSVRALANHLLSPDVCVDLLSTVEDGQATAAGDDRATLKIFPRVAPRWLCRSPGMNQQLAATDYDLVHNHALWLLPLRYARAAARRTGAPLVISPRGMLSGWAYAHRRWRKRLAEIFVHPGAFSDAAGWHATSAEEADDIRRLGFTQPICVAPNGVPIPDAAELARQRTDWRQLAPALAGRRVALFYSRFHRKKRLRELIDLWNSTPRGDWLLLIAGVEEDYRVAEIQEWILAAGASESILVFDGADRSPPYGAAEIFLLPSHSENFGLVIAEALAAGVPALVTDTTPWRELAAHGAGWCVPWADYAAALQSALARPAAELSAMGAAGRTWAERDFSWAGAARQLHAFYRQLIHARS